MVLYNYFRNGRRRETRDEEVEATGGSFVYVGMANYARSRRFPRAHAVENVMLSA